LEVESIAQILEYYAKNGERLLAPERLDLNDPNAGDGLQIYQPLGIVFEIEPWNVPFFQIIRPLAAQLMAGNTVILKHAPNVPQCSAAAEKLFKDAGLPEGVFTNLYISHDQSDRIIADSRVCGVTLTGSGAAGAQVAAQAGKYLKRVVLELGGSDAMIVLDNTDIDTAVRGAMMGRLTLSGQACVEDKRMFIANSVYDEFYAKLTGTINALIPGDPMDPKTTFAPVSSQQAEEQVKSQINEAVAHGATATQVGVPVPAQGAFVQPTILTNVTVDNPIFNQEIFGPVLMLFRFSDEEEAIERANSTQFGLGGSVYSDNMTHAYEVAKKIVAGAISINQPTIPSPALPFGGVKNSGIGRELGVDGIKEFMNHKTINGQRVKGIER
jgi:succinate-semialdehyde dehydrogenase/glutarate-semialdehyde dehydrogenase